MKMNCNAIPLEINSFFIVITSQPSELPVKVNTAVSPVTNKCKFHNFALNTRCAMSGN